MTLIGQGLLSYKGGMKHEKQGDKKTSSKDERMVQISFMIIIGRLPRVLCYNWYYDQKKEQTLRGLYGSSSNFLNWIWSPLT